jgi:hypothetical protein
MFSRGKAMSTAKEEVQKILNTLPENSSYEDIQYHIFVREKIELGLDAVKRGDLVSSEEMEKKFSKWLGN